MSFRFRFSVLGGCACLFVLSWLIPSTRLAAACVWKVTAPDGHMIYLAGSIHGLRGTDYPLPSAYNRAFDASSRLVIEDDPKVSARAMKNFFKAGDYKRGDSLKNHIDPRTYDYLRRVFAIWNVPEADFAKLRPWKLVMWFTSFGTNSLGVDSYLMNRAQANRKPITGLESFHEHGEIISGLTDHQAELVLLMGFIPQAPGTDQHKVILDAWRRGDADRIARIDREGFQDLPSFYQRLIVDRNHNWIPKIEGLIRSGQAYFVVAGAGHMGGPEGVLALLRNRGYRIEEL